MKKIVLSCLVILCCACGKTAAVASYNLGKDLPYVITANISLDFHNSIVYIRAADVVVDREKMEVTIKSPAFISDNHIYFGVGLTDTKISIPIGGKVVITGRGKEITLEKYGDKEALKAL